MIEQILALLSLFITIDKDVEPYYGSGVEITGYANEFEYEINIQEIQKQVIIEDYFTFLDRLGRINYARGCAGEATPPSWNGKKRVRCGIRSFDCGGMMKYYGRVKGIIEQKELAYLNSKTLYELGDKKDPRTAERGDFMYWKANSKGSDATHFAVITTGYRDGVLTIMDNFTPGNPGKINERHLKVVCNSKYCMYMGKYKIHISSNGMVKLASERGILVNAFKIVNEE